MLVKLKAARVHALETVRAEEGRTPVVSEEGGAHGERGGGRNGGGGWDNRGGLGRRGQGEEATGLGLGRRGHAVVVGMRELAHFLSLLRFL